MADREQQAEHLAREVLAYSRNVLFINLRFLESALSRLVPAPYDGSVGTDLRHLFFDSPYVLQTFRESPQRVTRIYLHSVLHCIFQHPFVGSVDPLLWDLACDIAVEAVLRDLSLGCVDADMEFSQNAVLNALQQQVNPLTAEKLYYHFYDQGLSAQRIEELHTYFRMDDHTPWYQPVSGGSPPPSGSPPPGIPPRDGGSGDDPDDQNMAALSEQEPSGSSVMSPEEARQTWKKLSKQIQLDLESFSRKQGDEAGKLLQNLRDVNRERYDYSEFLRKFAVSGEVMRIDQDSFDYNFYTYGLQLYGNLPLIEPLEYKDERRIREFVIAIDTSGSVHGETVQRFVQKTYNILKSQESFFSRINLHIIQCDAQVQEDIRITSQEEFDSYLETMTLRGFGGTDFRPVFSYVQTLLDRKEFTDLRGLLYFTDGYGHFPQKQPPYQTAFVFLENEENNYEVPVWAMRVILESRDLEEERL